MKSTIALIAFLALATFGLSAQNTNGQGNTSGPGNPGQGWGQQYGWPKYVIDWLEQGGDIPHPLCLNVLWHAKDWAQAEYGLNYGQLVAKFNQGQASLEYVSLAPPSLTFRLSYGGGMSIIILTDF